MISFLFSPIGSRFLDLIFGNIHCNIFTTPYSRVCCLYFYYVENDENWLRVSKSNLPTTDLVLNHLNCTFFLTGRNRRIPCFFPNQQFLDRPQFWFDTDGSGLALKSPTFTCKIYFKPRFRLILSEKVSFNQIVAFRQRKWNILTTMLTICWRTF